MVYREVTNDWPRPRRQSLRATVPSQRRHYVAALSGTTLHWREIRLTSATIDAATDEVGIYLFVTSISLGGRTVEVILYVGRTTNLRTRLASYLRIKKGYDDKRPSIVDMFNAYRDTAKLLFAPVPEAQLGSVERAIYETAAPEFNVLAPPKH